MRSWRPRHFALVCWAATIVPASLSFAAQCGGNTALNYCGVGLPDNFCCESGSICKQLFNVITPAIICCPSGSSCDQLNTISCNTTIQADAGAPAHMFDTRVSLPPCGPQCCPLGYQCAVDPRTNAYSCQIKDSTKLNALPSNAPSETKVTVTVPSSVPTPQSLSWKTTSTAKIQINPSTTTSTSSSIPLLASGDPSGNSHVNKFPTTAVLATLFPAIAVGVILVLLVIFLKRRRERNRTSIRGEEIFGGPTPPQSSRGLQISSPLDRPDMTARTDFIHKRSASENATSLPISSSPMRHVIQASQNLRRTLSSGGTLVPTASLGQKTPTMSLGPIFETPTRPQRAEQKGVRALFSSNASTRSKSSPASRYPSVNPTRLILSRSGASQETIDVLMRPAPADFEAFGSPLEPLNGRSPVTRQTTYSDVYRAAGVSPTKAESRARQLMIERAGMEDQGSTMDSRGVIDRESGVRFKF